MKNKIFLKIYAEPNLVLRNPNYRVDDVSPWISFAVDMIYTCQRVRGMGLAAPQVGENVQLFIAIVDKKPLVVFNPKITGVSLETLRNTEGCLSCPGVAKEVERPKKIQLTYNDFKGRLIENKIFEGLNAIVLQHEIDHLNGKLIMDYPELAPISPIEVG